jgi:transcriptional regulator with XRE-family HTH domain
LRNDPKAKDKKLAKSLGALIAARRKSLGLTQGELAETVGIEQESMSRIETGMITPSLSRLLSLADALDCSIETLLRPASDRKQDQSLVMEGLLNGLDDAERAFAVRVVSDFADFSRSRRNKRSKS